MKFRYRHVIVPAILVFTTMTTRAENAVVDSLLKEYQSQGAKTADAQRGEMFWSKSFTGQAPFTERSCKTCHSAKLENTGKHIRTGKEIKPLAPSANPQSLTDPAKIQKWLKRNCKWTTGKECSAQEKSDILAFIQQQ